MSLKANFLAKIDLSGNLEMEMDVARSFLRHTLATLAYRAGKTLRDAPLEFATYRTCESSPSPEEILAHMGDLMDWALTMVEGRQAWKDSDPLEWHSEIARFFAALQKLDDFLRSDRPIVAPLDRLFQGPVADALTHTGQLAMLRRMSGAAMKGENYYVADISVGRVMLDQSAPKKEF